MSIVESYPSTYQPYQIVNDSKGNMYIAIMANTSLFSGTPYTTTNGMIQIISNKGDVSYLAFSEIPWSDNPNYTYNTYNPSGLAIDEDDNLYICTYSAYCTGSPSYAGIISKYCINDPSSSIYYYINCSNSNGNYYPLNLAYNKTLNTLYFSSVISYDKYSVKVNYINLSSLGSAPNILPNTFINFALTSDYTYYNNCYVMSYKNYIISFIYVNSYYLSIYDLTNSSIIHNQVLNNNDFGIIKCITISKEGIFYVINSDNIIYRFFIDNMENIFNLGSFSSTSLVPYFGLNVLENNLYISCQVNSSENVLNANIIKYNPEDYSKIIETQLQPYQFAHDSHGNIYVAISTSTSFFQTNSTQITNGLIQKITPEGNSSYISFNDIPWSDNPNYTYNTFNPTGLAIDENDNLYICTYTAYCNNFYDNPNPGLISKYCINEPSSSVYNFITCNNAYYVFYPFNLAYNKFSKSLWWTTLNPNYTTLNVSHTTNFFYLENSSSSNNLLRDNCIINQYAGMPVNPTFILSWGYYILLLCNYDNNFYIQPFTYLQEPLPEKIIYNSVGFITNVYIKDNDFLYLVNSDCYIFKIPLVDLSKIYNLGRINSTLNPKFGLIVLHRRIYIGCQSNSDNPIPVINIVNNPFIMESLSYYDSLQLTIDSVSLSPQGKVSFSYSQSKQEAIYSNFEFFYKVRVFNRIKNKTSQFFSIKNTSFNIGFERRNMRKKYKVIIYIYDKIKDKFSEGKESNTIIKTKKKN